MDSVDDLKPSLLLYSALLILMSLLKLLQEHSWDLIIVYLCTVQSPEHLDGLNAETSLPE